MKQVLKNWDSDEECPIRITEAAIARRVLNKNNLFESYRMHYPKISAFIESIVEDTETYYKRCIDRVAIYRETKYISLNPSAITFVPVGGSINTLPFPEAIPASAISISH